MKRLSLKWSAFLAALLLTAAPSRATDPVNVVWILVDDMGYGDLRCYGAPDVDTPHIDRLASQGVRFTHYYANGAECTPTRTALLTGRYPARFKGLECAIGTGNVGRYDDAITQAEAHQLGLATEDSFLPRAFKDAGYITGIFGKWHLGYEAHLLPLKHGFDHFFGVLGGNCDYFTHRELSPIPVLYRDHQPTQADGYMTHLITREAVQFLDDHHQKPFFLYVPYTTPHFPFQTPQDGEKTWTEEQWMAGTRKPYLAMIEDLDRAVGMLLERLEKLKLAENTLVLFGSDHGGMGPSRNAPWRGAKGGLFEGGIRTAMIARWPGILPAGTTSSQTCLTMDFTRSIAGMLRAPTTNLDGIDILKHLREGKPNQSRKLYWRARRGDRTWKAIRSGEWKYIHRVQGNEEDAWLFHLGKDPSEERNLLALDNSILPPEATTLPQALAAWEAEMR